MRILVDGEVLQYAHTGVAKVTLGLYRALLAVDPSVQVSFICRGGGVEEIPVGVSRIGVNRLIPRQLWRIGVLPVAARVGAGDIIHFPWNGRVAPYLRIPVLTTVHDVLPLAIPGFFRSEEDEGRYRRGLAGDLARSSLVITDSDYSKQAILRHFRPTVEPVVISPATEIADVPLGDQAREEGKYFLYVGGYTSRKGIEELLRAFHEGHRSERVRERLVLTGEPAHVSDECTRLIEEGRKRGYVEERGYVDESDLATLYRGATALLYPSKYEGFGLPPLEAMALGCPVVTTRETSLPEVCGEAAVYVEPSNTVGFVDVLSRLESDQAFRRGLSERGLAQSARFSYKKSAEKFLTLIRSYVR